MYGLVECVRNKLYGVEQGTTQDVSEDGNFDLLKPSGHQYHQFNIHNSAFYQHSVFMCFVWILEQNSDYFTVQH